MTPKLYFGRREGFTQFKESLYLKLRPRHDNQGSFLRKCAWFLKKCWNGLKKTGAHFTESVNKPLKQLTRTMLIFNRISAINQAFCRTWRNRHRNRILRCWSTWCHLELDQVLNRNAIGQVIRQETLFFAWIELWSIVIDPNLFSNAFRDIDNHERCLLSIHRGQNLRRYCESFTEVGLMLLKRCSRWSGNWGLSEFGEDLIRHRSCAEVDDCILWCSSMSFRSILVY
jgi:hypothetical protein